MPEAVARARELLAPRLAGRRQECEPKCRPQVGDGRARRQLPERVEPAHEMAVEERSLAHRPEMPCPDPKRQGRRAALEERRDRAPRRPPELRDAPRLR